MHADDLRTLYLAYLDCLNRQAWDELGTFVCENAEHNGRAFGLAGYVAMLLEDYRSIPDLKFHAEFIVSEPPLIAARLAFNCSPRSMFLGLPVNGRTISFYEHVTYQFDNSKICRVWSILDKATIETQI